MNCIQRRGRGQLETVDDFTTLKESPALKQRMLKNILWFICLVTLLGITMQSWAAPIGIGSGAKTGTNHPMTEDIIAVCSNQSSPIKNVITTGSKENIFRVYEDRSTQYSIAQIDAAALQQLEDPKMMEKIMMIFPFFSVEVHLIAKDGSPINNLADLKGKNVIEGPEGSGTNVTVQMIKRMLQKANTGITWNTVPGNLSQQAGMDAVKNGTADAEFIVAGKPITMLKAATGVKLINVRHPAIAHEMYTHTTLFPDGSYAFQKGPINTFKVDNMLITYAFKAQYQKEIGELVSCLTKNIDRLQNEKKADGSSAFHPKWRDVNPLDISRIKWPAHPAAIATIKRESKPNKLSVGKELK